MNNPMTGTFDIVVVPDFTGSKPFTFELRTLFFLASWIENAGKAHDFPLHLACIGEPPASVKWLAQKCNARITIHEPIEAEKCVFLNKQRGFEVEAQTKRLLLLDADVLVLGDISELSQLGNCIAAAVENTARVSEAHWQRIFPALDIKLPVERIPSTRTELHLPRMRVKNYPSQEDDQEHMFPYYNGGIVFTSNEYELQKRWPENIHCIRQIFLQDEPNDSGDYRAVLSSDQAGLAVSIWQLRAQNANFQALSGAFHCTHLHLYRRTVPLRKAKLFHAIAFCDNAREGSSDLLEQIQYKLLYRRLRAEWRLNDRQRAIPAMAQYLLPALADAYRLNALLRRIYKKYVREALDMNK